ncbi:hypothetical protein CAPTEDRAFT_193511, partial [Capitella teleta]
TFIEQRKKQDTLPAETFKVAVSNNEERQKDGWNCGIFTLEFLTKDIGVTPDRDHESLLPPMKGRLTLSKLLYEHSGCAEYSTTCSKKKWKAYCMVSTWIIKSSDIKIALSRVSGGMKNESDDEEEGEQSAQCHFVLPEIPRGLEPNAIVSQ